MPLLLSRSSPLWCWEVLSHTTPAQLTMDGAPCLPGKPFHSSEACGTSRGGGVPGSMVLPPTCSTAVALSSGAAIRYWTRGSSHERHYIIRSEGLGVTQVFALYLYLRTEAVPHYKSCRNIAGR